MNSHDSYKVRLRRLASSLFVFTLSFFPHMLYAATTHDVVVGNNFFSPNNLTIEVGDTVRWTHSAGRFHDVTADDGSFASQTAGSFIFSRVFMSAEEILYHCTVHSSAGRDRNIFMNGRLNVVDATSSTDVSVDSFNAVDGAYQAGEDFRVTGTLRNNGNANSGMFNINFYASTDGVITTGDILLDSKAITDLPAGEIENIDESVDLPQSLASGDYFVGAIIDLDDTNLGNNTAVDDIPIFVFTDFKLNTGLNDAWFNPDTDGQGFFITVFPDLGIAIMAWFTYDTELPPEDATANLGDPGHRWLTAAGPFVDNQAVMNIEFTSGGIFNTPSVIQRTDPPGSDGTIVLTFKNCNEGSVEYDIATIDAQGTVPIQRVANDNVALCNELLRASQP